MKIHVNTVPEGGCEQQAQYDAGALDMERVDVHLRQPFAVSAFITRADQELIVKAAIRCPVRLVCARCLEEFERALALQAVFSYRVRPSDVVDITDDVRQEILLAYPMIPVCRAECKGLCPQCGQNLNVQACSHAPA